MRLFVCVLSLFHSIPVASLIAQLRSICPFADTKNDEGVLMIRVICIYVAAAGFSFGPPQDMSL